MAVSALISPCCLREAEWYPYSLQARSAPLTSSTRLLLDPSQPYNTDPYHANPFHSYCSQRQPGESTNAMDVGTVLHILCKEEDEDACMIVAVLAITCNTVNNSTRWHDVNTALRSDHEEPPREKRTANRRHNDRESPRPPLHTAERTRQLGPLTGPPFCLFHRSLLGPHRTDAAIRNGRHEHRPSSIKETFHSYMCSCWRRRTKSS
ncbi:hypothetical protein EDD15DRAFT_75022 [Pisolithus albus]|nr:hypothetical protein EDD15DRAFT_75022 [Pisolithus albus]